MMLLLWPSVDSFKSHGKAVETREHGEAEEGSSVVVEDSCLHYFECQSAGRLGGAAAA